MAARSKRKSVENGYEKVETCHSVRITTRLKTQPELGRMSREKNVPWGRDLSKKKNGVWKKISPLEKKGLN